MTHIFDTIDVLRLAAALTVLVFHVWIARERVVCAVSLVRQIAVQVIAQSIVWLITDLGILDAIIAMLMAQLGHI